MVARPKAKYADFRIVGVEDVEQKINKPPHLRAWEGYALLACW
jgi:hypothetical protein